MRTIHERGAEVVDRQQPGHWEGDLIVGSRNQSAIGTLVERTSRFTALVHIPDEKTAGTVTAGIVQVMRQVPGPIRRSPTRECGTEMAEHDATSQITGLAVYFCGPVSQWQRTTNENSGWLLRMCFAKGSELSACYPADLGRMQRELNNRPRKPLNGRTPVKVGASLAADSTPIVATTRRKRASAGSPLSVGVDTSRTPSTSVRELIW